MRIKLFFIIIVMLSTRCAPVSKQGITLKEDIVFNIIPKSNQLYPRDNNNKSKVIFTGHAYGKMHSIKIVCKNTLTNIETIVEENVKSSEFHIEFLIEAGLHEYQFRVFKVTSKHEELVKVINNVVSGDVYVVHGQSNAWSIDYDNKMSALPKESRWIRTMGSMHVYNRPGDAFHASNKAWYIAKGTAPNQSNKEYYAEAMVGVLGIKIGLNLVNNLKVPIAIINGAGGGGSIRHYLKTTDNDLNSTYGRLQYRIENASYKNSIKGFVWNQGESNGRNSMEVYKEKLELFYHQLSKDFSFEKFYLIQSPPGCSTLGSHVGVREAQRRFYLENKAKVSLMTRHGFLLNEENKSYYLDDNCHYHAEGYLQLADRTSDLILNDLYGGINDVALPNIVSAKTTSENTIILTFDKDATFEESLLINEKTYYLKDYFSFDEDSTIAINKMEKVLNNNKQLKLFVSKSPSVNTSITYLSKESYEGITQAYLGPWIRSSTSEIGVAGFTIVIE